MSLFVSVLFFISGACGLMYEVVWTRMMLLIFGRSSLAVGTVLAAFMGGMAVGGYALGKYADRSRNPLRLYALYEIGVGVTALIVSILLPLTGAVHIWVHALLGESSAGHVVSRFLMAFALLGVPTVLMGATLPILSRVVMRRRFRVGADLGRLYAINTIGAVVGSFASGFYIISRMGLHGTIGLAVAGNMAVGISAWLLSKRFYPEDIPAPGPKTVFPVESLSGDAGTRRTYRLLLWAFALSGVTSFSYEIFWTRSLVFLLGNTTYAFTLMLTAFLAGIALGGYGIRFLADRIKNPLRLFASIEILIGIFSATAVPLLFFIIKSEAVRSFVVRFSGNIELLAVSDFVIAASVMLLPATLIGATLPLMGKIFISDLKCAGTTVGKIYAVNTLGNVAGALLPGIVIMPLMGIQKGILLMAAINISAGAALIISPGKRFKTSLAAGSMTLLALLISIVQIPTHFQFPSEYQRAKDEVRFYKEGRLVTTKVWASAETGYKMISVDGINIGGTSDSDYKQQILAHLPKLLLKSYRSELSIGVGSGILMGESARHHALKKIVGVEISQGVVEGARYFSDENFNILNDPRAVIVVDDIADFLQTENERFDIISADEKTTGKYASNSFSYSKDYYTLLRKRLAPGGIVIQWVPTDLPPSQYALALRTFLAGFSHVHLWYFPPVGRFTMSNTLLVGSNERIDIDAELMQRSMDDDTESFEGIRKYGLTNAESVLAHYVCNEETLRRFVPDGPVNSFNRPYYEFYSPADYTVPSDKRTLANHELLLSMRAIELPTIAARVRRDEKPMKSAFEAEELFFTGHRNQLRGAPEPEVISYYEAAITKAPWNINLREEVVSYLYREFTGRVAAGKYGEADSFVKRAAEILPQDSNVHYDYAWILWRTGRPDLAIAELERALTLNPRAVPVRQMLASLYASHGLADKAEEMWKEALALDPIAIPALVNYGVFLAKRRSSVEQAINYVRRAYDLAPQDPDVIDGYARVEYLSGNLSEAKRIVLKGGRYYESNPLFGNLRALILGGNG